MLYSASDKAKLLATNFSKNSNLDDSNNVLAAFPSRTNLKPHNIHVTSKLVKMVRKNLNSSEISGPDCIPFSGSEELRTWTFIHTSSTLQYVSGGIVGRPHLWFLHSRMLGKSRWQKPTTLLVCYLFSVVWKIIEKT